jgi:hypothetical protein
LLLTRPTGEEFGEKQIKSRTLAALRCLGAGYVDDSRGCLPYGPHYRSKPGIILLGRPDGRSKTQQGRKQYEGNTVTHARLQRKHRKDRHMTKHHGKDAPVALASIL